MSQKLPVNDFKWVAETSQFNKDFIKIYNEDSNIGYFIESDVQYPEKLHEVQNDLQYLPERTKIEKIEKLKANLQDKKEYVIQIRNLKQALNHGLVLKNVHKVITFNQKTCPKPYTDLNAELRKLDFEKNFSN